jgi:hypothetical protein
VQWPRSVGNVITCTELLQTSGIKKGDGAESPCTCQPFPPDDDGYSRTIGKCVCTD